MILPRLLLGLWCFTEVLRFLFSWESNIGFAELESVALKSTLLKEWRISDMSSEFLVLVIKFWGGLM